MIIFLFIGPSLKVKREVDPGEKKMITSVYRKNVKILGKEINDALKSVWGGQCVSDSDCAGFISYCDKDQGYTGEIIFFDFSINKV